MNVATPKKPPEKEAQAAEQHKPIVPEQEKGNHPLPEPGKPPSFRPETLTAARPEGVVSNPDFV
jgi:hypothetical protein